MFCKLPIGAFENLLAAKNTKFAKNAKRELLAIFLKNHAGVKERDHLIDSALGVLGVLGGFYSGFSKLPIVQ